MADRERDRIDVAGKTKGRRLTCRQPVQLKDLVDLQEVDMSLKKRAYYTMKSRYTR